MEKQLIISVGREFGSGGHEVAQKLADDYGIALYDHDLLKEIATKKNLKSEDLEAYDEMEPLSVSYCSRTEQFTGAERCKPAV